MALPPIISNLPILKLFRNEQSNVPTPQNDASKSGGSSLPRDVVELSDAALERVNNAQNNISSETQARDTAEDVRNDLSNNTDVVLGMDAESFSA